MLLERRSLVLETCYCHPKRLAQSSGESPSIEPSTTLGYNPPRRVPHNRESPDNRNSMVFSIQIIIYLSTVNNLIWLWQYVTECVSSKWGVRLLRSDS
jgi:hypothetical protein